MRRRESSTRRPRSRAARLSPGPRASDVLWYLERGHVAERLGDRDRALEAYRFVAAAWRRPDPELEPYAAEARAGLARLTAEPGKR